MRFIADGPTIPDELLEASDRALSGVTWHDLIALGSCDFSKNKGERFITITTAAFSMWNVGLAFVAGMTFADIPKRGWLRL